jgi:Na+/proline symporter/nitrogen-specific signal transduction histidine kinase
MPSYVLALVIVGYLGVLFALGVWADRNATSRWVRNPWVYALSLAVYCSAWTYYGSVGIAATDGVSFLTTYLGPVIALPLWVIVLKRIVILSHNHQVSSIADFISFRYGNNRSVGAIVTLICVIAVLPYISLQLKAVSETFDILTGREERPNILFDSTFWIAVLLAGFAAIFGTRTADASSQRAGLLFTVAVESLLKLTFFLLIGVYTTFYLFDGPQDIYDKVSVLDGFEKLVTFSGLEASLNWYFMIALSFFAIFLLPRQFHVSVVENTSTKHLNLASWAFPAYLLLFNVFVIYIAWAGKLLLSGDLNPDYYTLYLPLAHGNRLLGLMVFLGGLSSVISMVMISALALSTMISNNLIIPYGFLQRLNDGDSIANAQIIKNIRRIAIFTLIVSAYFIYVNFNVELSLYSLGLMAFVMIAQLAPAFFIGLFWNRGNATAAKAGMLSGVVVALYTLILPFAAAAFDVDAQFLTGGPFGIELLRPSQLFGIDFLKPIPNAFFWSILVNTMMYLILSVILRGNYRERNYAEIVVNASSYTEMEDNAFVWQGEAYVADIRRMLERFLGKEKTSQAMEVFNQKYGLDETENKADARLISYSEKILTGSVGAASAKLLISSVVKEHPVSLPKVLEILEESKETIVANKQLQRQSQDLRRLSESLEEANEALRERDRQKDDFLDTVAHELKTPTASIRAASEVLADADDMPPELRKRFLENIVSDADRLTVLITNILDLEKLSNGREVLRLMDYSICETIGKSVAGVYQLALKKGITIDASDCQEVTLEYDEDRIIQVFTNLLVNSIKFVPKEEGRIIIRTKQIDDLIQISVEDNGKGISAVDIPFVFDKFFQSNDQNIKKPVGSGMGLAISRYIMESHEGGLSVDPHFVNGARFIVELKKPPT